MSLPDQAENNNLNYQANLVGAVSAFVPGAADCCPEIPPTPTRLLNRKDMARVLGRHPDTIHVWEQKGLLKAIRTKTDRIVGYPVEQVAAVAARLYRRFVRMTVNEVEAERLGYLPLLTWVLATVRSAAASAAADKEPLLDLLALASLAEAPEVVSEKHQISAADLEDHKAAALAQLRTRLKDPYARHLLLKGWRESGIAARVRAISNPPKDKP